MREPSVARTWGPLRRSCGSQKILVTGLKAGSFVDRGEVENSLLSWESGWGSKSQTRSKNQWNSLSTPVSHRGIHKKGFLFERTERCFKARKRLHFPFCPWVLVQCGSKVSRRKLEWGTQWKWWAGKAKGEQRGDGCRGTSALKLYLRFLIIFFLTAYILSLV